MNDAVVWVSAYLFLTALFGLVALSVAAPNDSSAPRGDRRAMWMVAGGAVGAASIHASGTGTALPIVVALASSTVCAITDAQIGYIFDRVTASGTILAVGCAAMTGRGEAAVEGALCGASLLFALWLLTRRRGIGLGDVKLAALLGAASGPACIMVALGGAFVLGACIACCGLLARRLSLGSSLRFAPYMAAAFALTAAVTGSPA